MGEISSSFDATQQALIEGLLAAVKAIELSLEKGHPLSNSTRNVLRDLLAFNDNIDKELGYTDSNLKWTHFREIARGSNSPYHFKYAIMECYPFGENLHLAACYLHGKESFDNIKGHLESLSDYKEAA